MMQRELGIIKRLVVLTLLGVLAASPVAAATLTGVEVSAEGAVTKIHVTLDEPVEFDHFTLADPARFVLDCIGVTDVAADLPGPAGRAIEMQADVWKGAGDHAVTRLMIDLDSPASAQVEATSDGLVITLSPEEETEWLDEPDAGEVELTPAEEAFEFAQPVRPSYEHDFVRGDTETVYSFMQDEKGGLAAMGGPRVSLDVQGADIYTVLRSISEYSGRNIVMGYDVRSEVASPLSFHLEDVPWGEALETVLRSAHLWYEEENGILRVDTEENLRNERLQRGSASRQLEEVLPLTTRIVNVIYANANELKVSVEKSLSNRGIVEVDYRTNSLVITDIARRVESVAQMVQHLDSQTPQVEIVAKLVEVDARFTRDLGVFWKVGNIHENGVSTALSAGSNKVVDPTGDIRFGVVKDWGNLDLTLSAMEQDNKANIISNPRITTVNNREARILVGKKIPLIVLDEAGNSVTQLITIGITLLVNPHINDNNYITLDMHPEVSDLSSQATVQGGVIINTSEADTRVMVGNGETAVIGGLIRSNETRLERGVPVLKDIPVLGWFFKGSSTVKEKRELLIFVTPRIISSFASNESSNGE